MSVNSEKLIWHKVLNKDDLPEGRVKPVTCAQQSLHSFQGVYNEVY